MDALIIALSGGSCSGKTTLSRHLQSRFGPELCMMVRQDDYYYDLHERSSDGTLPNFDVPEAIDFTLLKENLLALKAGQDVALPRYDFTTHRRLTPAEPTPARPIILVEGILLFTDPDLCDVYDHRIYIKCGVDLRFQRRLSRDTAERGRTVECVTRQFFDEVEVAHQQFVAPSACRADLIVPQKDYMTNLHAVTNQIVGRLPADFRRIGDKTPPSSATISTLSPTL